MCLGSFGGRRGSRGPDLHIAEAEVTLWTSVTETVTTNLLRLVKEKLNRW